MPYVVTETQPTPNPNALKFLLDRAITTQPVSFLKPEAGVGDALAEKLFAIQGVTSLLLLGDFVTVNKTPDANWKGITAAVKKILATAC